MKCQCLNCGYAKTTNEHCRSIRCPRCGGQMRRSDRPGRGG